MEHKTPRKPAEQGLSFVAQRVSALHASGRPGQVMAFVTLAVLVSDQEAEQTQSRGMVQRLREAQGLGQTQDRNQVCMPNLVQDQVQSQAQAQS